MTDECRPPAGTPPRTTCWLYYDPPAGTREWVAMIWLGYAWAAVYDVGVNRVTRHGWRFLSIAEPPDA